MLELSKKIPLSYQAQNGDHIILDGLDDFGFMLDYFIDDNNAHSLVRNYGKWHNEDKKYAVLCKEDSFLYPTKHRISGLDWMKLTEQFVGFQIFTGPGAPALTNEVVQIASGFKEMSDATKNSHAEFEAAKEVVNTTDTNFSTNVARIYNKVQQLERLWKVDIVSFNNAVTISTGVGGVARGTCIYKNFIEWPTTTKTFLINKDGSSFRMLKYTTSFKKKEFYKRISKMTEWNHWGFYEWYKELMNQCYEYRIWILSYHLLNPSCQED